MGDLAITPDGRLDLRGGDIRLTAPGVETVAQRARSALRTHEGEWALDLSYGVDWRGRILGRAPSAAALRAVLRDALESLPGVAEVGAVEVAFDRARREARFDVAIVAEDDDGRRTTPAALSGTLDADAGLWLVVSSPAGIVP